MNTSRLADARATQTNAEEKAAASAATMTEERKQADLVKLREQAVQEAKTEGLELVRYAGNSTGFKGVQRGNGKTSSGQTGYWRGRPYAAKPYFAYYDDPTTGKRESLGTFRVAEEGALAYARKIVAAHGKAELERIASETISHVLSQDEADELVRQEEAQGLVMARCQNESGFKGVFKDKSSSLRSWRVVMPASKEKPGFATKEEAAIYYAKTAEGRHSTDPEKRRQAEEQRNEEMERERGAQRVAALAKASELGVELLRSENEAGYLGVTRAGETGATHRLPWKVQLSNDTPAKCFATPEEASLWYMQTDQGMAAARKAANRRVPSRSLEETEAIARESGVDLLTADNASGYLCVVKNEHCVRPYQVQVHINGMQQRLPEYFEHPWEAALHFRLMREGEEAARKRQQANAPLMNEEEAESQAASKNLTLVRAMDEKHPTGFVGVIYNSTCPNRPYVAQLKRNGQYKKSPRTPSKFEAALFYAEMLGPEESNAAAAKHVQEAQPSMSAQEALRLAAEERLTLRSKDGIYVGVVHLPRKNGKPWLGYVSQMRTYGPKIARPTAHVLTLPVPLRRYTNPAGTVVSLHPSCATQEEAALRLARAQKQSCETSASTTSTTAVALTPSDGE